MEIVGLVEEENHVCCRYRLRALAPVWAAAGHRLVLQRLPRDCWRRWFWNPSLAQADVVVLQRKLLPSWSLVRLRRYARRLVYDVDDALWLRDSYAAQGLEDRRRRHRFARLVQLCDLVVAGNAFIARTVSRWAPHTPVTVIPTCVDPAIYPLARHDATGSGEIRLVWIGSSSTLQGLHRFRDTLSLIGECVPNIRLKLICDRSLEIKSLPVDFVPWSASSEADELAASDIGISWLPEDDWSRGKCGLKVLQYQAAGLPVVVNPVGVQAELVQPGRTGYWARTASEWVEAVQRLAADAHLRRRLGAEGRRQVEQHYSVGRAAQRWLEELQQRQHRWQRAS
jgi:glycosyltransferase involved in cell wall biosynthesis